MGTIATKAFDNVYYQARLAASSFDKRFKSREKTAEALCISTDSLCGYELGYVKYMPSQMVVTMAEMYHAPHLLNNYCACDCPIGIARGMTAVPNRNVEQTAFAFMQALKNAEATQDKLIKVVEDGKVTPDELPTLNDVVAELSKYARLYDELKNLIEKVRE